MTSGALAYVIRMTRSNDPARKPRASDDTRAGIDGSRHDDHRDERARDERAGALAAIARDVRDEAIRLGKPYVDAALVPGGGE